MTIAQLASHPPDNPIYLPDTWAVSAWLVRGQVDDYFTLQPLADAETGEQRKKPVVFHAVYLLAATDDLHAAWDMVKEGLLKRVAEIEKLQTVYGIQQEKA